MPLNDAPWDIISKSDIDLEDDQKLKILLLDAFKISQYPQKGYSLKPFVLLFDEYYTNLYRMHEAELKMKLAERFVFMGTSFSVNITCLLYTSPSPRDRG